MDLDHIVFNAVNIDKMIEFYSEVLGLPTERVEEYRSGQAPFPSLRINDVTIIDLFPKQLWQTKSHSGPGRENLNHFCIALSKEAWQDLQRRLEARGIPVEEGPVTRWGARGDGTSIYFRDPERNLIEAKFYEAI
ncbi:MAG: VOC family protein [Desulfomonilaceae bacterium]